VDLMERVPVRYWVDDAGSALLVGWANLLIGRSTRALELIQSPPLRTPVGAAIKRLVWAQGVWWSTGPAEALGLIAEGRTQLDELPVGVRTLTCRVTTMRPRSASLPTVPKSGPDFSSATLTAASIARLDPLIAQPSQLEPISVAGLHAVGALVRAFRGDRNEALTHISRPPTRCSTNSGRRPLRDDACASRTSAARCVAGDTSAVAADLERAVRQASDSGAANFQQVCELVADIGGVAFEPRTPISHNERRDFRSSSRTCRFERRVAAPTSVTPRAQRRC
jgi:hypothetical protein